MKFTYTFPTKFWDAAAITLSESLKAVTYRIKLNTEDKINLEGKAYISFTDDFQGVRVYLNFLIKDALAPKEVKALMEELIYLEKNLEKDVEYSDKKAEELHKKYFEKA